MRFSAQLLFLWLVLSLSEGARIKGRHSHHHHRDLQEEDPHRRYSCPQTNPEQYETSLLLTHDGTSSTGQAITDNDFAALELAMLKTYNDLSEDICDSQFRNITQVAVDRDTLTNVRERTLWFTVRYVIAGYCDGCSRNKGGPLFGEMPEYPSSSSSSGDDRRGRKRQLRQFQASKKKATHEDDKERELGKRSGRNPCYCASKRRRRGRNGPEEDDWMEEINDMLQSSSTARASSTNYTVSSLVEVKELACSAASTFPTVLLMEVDDGEPNDLTEEEEVALERAVAQTYNQLVFDQCDDKYFRSLQDVTISKPPAAARQRHNKRTRRKQRRRLSCSSSSRSCRSGGASSFNSSKVIKFTAQANCHGCPLDTTSLFDATTNSLPVSRRRHLQQQAPQQQHSSVTSLSVNIEPSLLAQAQGRQQSACFCSARNVNASGAPSTTLFQSTFSDELDDLDDVDIVESIESIGQFIEVKEFACSATADSLQSTIFLQVTGDLDDLDDEARQELAEAFQTSYNEFLFDACDPYFRRATSVIVDEGNYTTWLGRQPFSARFDTERLMRVTVQFECRGDDCTRNDSGLFSLGEETSTPTPFLVSGSSFNQNIQSFPPGSCFCPVGRVGDRAAATASAFREAFTWFLDVSDIDEVDEVLELDAFNCGNSTTVTSTKLVVEVSTSPDDAPSVNQTNTYFADLEQTMAVIYNALNFETLCDNPHFRTALRFRVLGDEVATAATSSVLTVNAAYECRSCLEGTPLFSWTNEPAVDFPYLNLSAIGGGGFERLTEMCYCPKTTALVQSRSPTETEFASALNVGSGRRRMQSASPTVLQVVEVKELACPRDQFAFQTEVYLRLKQNVTSLSAQEREEIRSGFEETYNSLNFFFCDTVHYRRVLRVKLDPDQNRRRSQEVYEVFDGTGDDNLLRLVVAVGCRDCDNDSTLFTNSSQASDQVEVQESALKSSLVQRLAAGEDLVRNSTSPCRCSATFPSQGRAPTTEEFLASFNSTIVDLQEFGALNEKQAVEEVIEIKPVDCSDDVQQFESKVVVSLEGDLELLTPEEKTALEEAFKESYNELSFLRCDSLFRNILDVTLVPASVQSVGRRQLQSNATGVNSTTSTVDRSDRALYSITGQCRGCPVTNAGTFGLFDDTFRRDRILEHVVSANGEVRRSLQNQVSGCVCPVNTDPVAPDAPTEDEFSKAYDSAVTDLRAQGTLVNVEGVSDITACDKEVREITDVYGLFFDGNVDSLSDEEKRDLILESFNSLRTDICSAQVVDVFLLDESQNSGTDANVVAEVLAVSERSLQNGAFSGDGSLSDVEFLANMNSQLISVGADTTAQSIEFLTPLVSCSDQRSTYRVSLEMSYQSVESLVCPEREEETGNGDDNEFNDDAEDPNNFDDDPIFDDQFADDRFIDDDEGGNFAAGRGDEQFFDDDSLIDLFVDDFVYAEDDDTLGPFVDDETPFADDPAFVDDTAIGVQFVDDEFGADDGFPGTDDFGIDDEFPGTDDFGIDDGPTDDGFPGTDDFDDFETDDGPTDDGPTDDGIDTDDGETDDGTITDDGGTDDGGDTDDGDTDDGGTADGGTDDGTNTDDGGTDDGGDTDDGDTDDGATDDGGDTDDGGTDDGTDTDNGGTDDGTDTDDGGNDNGGDTDDGGTDDGTDDGEFGGNPRFTPEPTAVSQTDMPTSTPGNFEPTSTPGNSEPTADPQIDTPTSTPGNSEPTSTPGNSEPTAEPQTDMPTSTADTPEPTPVPQTDLPTSTQGTPEPSPGTQTDMPTSTADTPEPTPVPQTDLPTSTQGTPEPSPGTQTDMPTSTTDTPEPSPGAQTDMPTSTPETPEPSPGGQIDMPTSTPETPAPTPVPQTDIPTSNPDTPEPTPVPQTDMPTSSPDTPEPTPVPETDMPTGSPDTPEPTPVPETDMPTSGPDTPEPTPVPETDMPTELVRNRRLQSQCTGRPVARRVQRVFEETYEQLALQLCDPFKRRIQAISCEYSDVESDFSGTLSCEIEFRCSGPCGEWIDDSAIYQQNDVYETANSCTCSSTGAAQAPLSTDHINAINAALVDITIQSISNER